MTFTEFKEKYLAGLLDCDAAWRAYDIPSVATHPAYVKKALKLLKLAYAGELAIPEFCARYGVSLEEARPLLGSWFLWSMIDQGRPFRVPLRTAKAG